ncbi:MAG TPA: four helix bundle protein [Candidatus Goldiibacteriota bacterium]|nr:four helix bundle protein [Candidatus Goldiibacteriota bacterium]
MGFDFRDTDVYKLSLEYRKTVKKIISENKVDKDIVDQITRAASSVTLNIAEGFGRFHKAEKRHFYVIARASVNECVACADIIFDSKISDSFLESSETLAKMLSGLINKFKE